MDSNYWEMKRRSNSEGLVVESFDLSSSNLLPEIKAKYRGKIAFAAYMRTSDAASIRAPVSQEFADLLNRRLASKDICQHGYMDLHTQYDKVFVKFWGICK